METEDMSGRSLGRYQLLAQIGLGGMAVVYKARDLHLDRDVAIKIIRKDCFVPNTLDRVLKRFEREAKSLAQLSHPNIVKVIDYGEFEGAPYLVLEYLSGGTLEKLLGRPIPYQDAARILLPAAQALAYAHQRNIIHRDVKPSNVLFTESRHAMLADFGIAKLLEDTGSYHLTDTSAIVGTPAYMAPEQAMGKAVDARTDVYALGIVLYEMVTGQKPFVADTPMAVVLKHVTDSLPPPRQFVPELPDKAEQVLLKALAKDPADRYENMGRFCDALACLAIEQDAPSLNSTANALLEKEKHESRSEIGSPTPPPITPSPEGGDADARKMVARVNRLEKMIVDALSARDFDDAESLLVNLQGLGEPGAQTAGRLRQEMARLRQQEALEQKAQQDEAELLCIEAGFRQSLAAGDFIQAEVMLQSLSKFGGRGQEKISTLRVELETAHREAVRRKAEMLHLNTPTAEATFIPTSQTTVEVAPPPVKVARPSRNFRLSRMAIVVVLLCVGVVGVTGLVVNFLSVQNIIPSASKKTPTTLSEALSITPPPAKKETPTGEIVEIATNTPLSHKPAIGSSHTVTPRMKPTKSPTPTLTDSILSSATQPFAATSAFFATVVEKSVNIRTGPGLTFGVMLSYKKDTRLEVIGRNEAGDWLVIALEDGKKGWVFGKLLSYAFEVNQLAVVQSPPTPLPPAAPPKGESAAPQPTDNSSGTPTPPPP
jgi:serine/threonine protein kinase/uncharacterized protein YraI